MANPLTYLFAMNISENLSRLRRERGLTLQKMADLIGLHLNQVRRYETGEAQPSREALKKIALALHLSTDALIFGEERRAPSDERLRLQFEAVAKLDRKERDAIQTLIDGVLLMHDAKRYSARASG
jgi:transcriptional regulator with XRE-family HTH domain